MKGWYVLETKRHAELRAARALEQQLGARTYAPRTKLWPAPSVGRAVVPVFPGYVFAQVEVPDDYYRAIYTPGVKRFVHDANGAPAAIPDEVVVGLHERENDEGLIDCGGTSDAGRSMRITTGPLKDFCGILERRMSGRERAILLVTLLQRDVRVEVPEAWLTTT